MGVLTVHHWCNARGGLAECGRAARRRIVFMTWDPDAPGFWLVDHYVPELIAHDRRVFPPISTFRSVFSRVSSIPVPVPADCVDGFLGAYWRRPEAYLDPAVRDAMSSFRRVPDIDDRMRALAADLRSGAWERRNGHLRNRDEMDLGYRIVVAEVA